jgi:periplasmic protein TonB
MQDTQAKPIHRRAMLAWLGLLLPCMAALAQRPFAQPPEPRRPAQLAPSMAVSEQDYRKDAARHLYDLYPAQVLKGKVRANVYAIMVTETRVDAQGKVLAVRVLRGPAEAHEVTPWVVALIRKASPLPAPLQLKRARYVETWLVDRSGQFQVRTLTEGQL